MDYFRTRGGNIFYGKSLMIDKEYVDITAYENSFNEEFHVEITREEFINAYEQVIKKLNKKVYGSK